MTILQTAFLIGLWLICPLSAFAKEQCYDDAVCIRDKEETDGIVTFVVTNLKPTEIIVTMEALLDNATASHPLPRVVELRPNAKMMLIELRRTDPTKQWEYKYRARWQWGRLGAKHDPNYVYTLPYPSGETYKVAQGYDGKFSHNGKNAIDFAMPIGSPIHSARDGLVVAVSDDSRIHGASVKYRQYANYILVKHEDGTFGGYYHLDYRSAKVKAGQQIKRGELIALSGNTGYTVGPHLHFEVTSPKDGFTLESYPVFFQTIADTAIVPTKGLLLTAP